MALNVDAVGFRADPFEVTWTSKDAILYALGVGAGQRDPARELSWTTDNTDGVQHRVIPTFGIALGQSQLLKRIPIGEFDRSSLLHADQQIETDHEIPSAGTATVRATLDEILDKRSGALVRVSTRADDVVTGRTLWRTRLGYFIRGEGGFGGRADSAESWEEPSGSPDEVYISSTRSDQALLYRLSGDLNPLHSDPSFAARAGFRAPILHGLCTFGVVHRGLLHALCDGNSGSFRSMYARFSKPVLPGAELHTQIWRDSTGARFKTMDDTGSIALDRGRFDLR